MFVVNSQHYHFETYSQLDRSKLQDCYFYETREEVVEHIKKHLGLDEDEICISYSLEDQSDSLGAQTKLIDDRGFAGFINEPIEDVIRDYVE